MTSEPAKPKKRFIIGHRFGPRLDEKASRELDSFIAAESDVSLMRRTSVGRCVVEMTQEQQRAFAEKNPDMVIEEDDELQLFPMPGLPKTYVEGETQTLAVKVSDAQTSKPVADVTLYGIGDGPAYKAVTDKRGNASLQTLEPTLRRVIASPRDTYWSSVVSDVSVRPNDPLTIALKPLLTTGAYDWGARLMGFRQTLPYWTGKGIKIGIVDSGVVDGHEDLSLSGGHNTLNGGDPKDWNVDEKGHGTHVAGVAAANNNRIGVLGGAPDAEIYSLKVFPGGRKSDLIEAIEWCIHHRIDVISMSLGGPDPSRLVAGVIKDAYDHGITCVAAAGNDRTHVAFPAALPTVIAVGAIGRFGTFPQDSAHVLKISRFTDRRGGLFGANFSNFGPEIDFCAPGIAILSSVPSGYAAWDGTSMSCPLVTALVALILEAYPSLRTGDANQAEYVRELLEYSAVDLGMPVDLQGGGLPLAPRVLPSTRPVPSFAPVPQQ